MLEQLAEGVKFIEALESDIGQQLLRAAMVGYEENLKKIIEEDKVTPRVRADFRAYKAILQSWSQKIANHNKTFAKVKKGSVDKED